MVWQGFPISPIGITYADCRFHLYGNLISKTEATGDFQFGFQALKDVVEKLYNHEISPEILICDAASAIHSACRNVFGSKVLVLMCYFHMKKALKKSLKLWFRSKTKMVEGCGCVAIIAKPRDIPARDKVVFEEV